MSMLLELAATGATSGYVIASHAVRGIPPASANGRPDQPLRQEFKRAVKPRTTRGRSMAGSQLAAFAVSAMVAIAAYHHASTVYDSRIVGLLAVSLLPIPVLGIMRCMLDPCAR